MSLPPLRGRPVLEGKAVLLIDPNQPTRDARTSLLESYGVTVLAAEDLFAARFLWKPRTYDLVLLDVRRCPPGEALQFYEQVKGTSPRQRFAFLVGPPTYVSRTWPVELIESERQSPQWAETMKTFMAAA